jgi:aryl-alcohol dehydrogenase-like predicted oxidoreductase
MEKRRLGQSDLEIAPIVLGGNVFGWTADEAMSFRVLDAFVDAGFNAIDTADSYSRWVPGHRGGESETLLGKWLKQSGKRDRVLIFTKVGTELAPEKKGLSKRYIAQAVDASLARLQTDRIDLYQAHRDDSATPIGETVEAFAGLIASGKIRAAGASNFTPARLTEALDHARAHGLPRYEALQPGYNLYDRADYEDVLEKICLREKIGVIPYYGLAAGFLTGKYRSPADFKKSQRGQRMKDYLDARGKRILKALDDVAAAHGTTQAAVALAWLVGRRSITAPIASATNPDQLKAFVSAVQLRLSPEDFEELNGASADARG